MELQSMESAMFLANTLYGLEINPDVFMELAIVAWNRIGNKYTRLYKFCGNICCDNLTLELPCNADIVEAVTYNYEDWNRTTNKNVNGDYSSLFIENYIETRKKYEDPLYISGKYAKYTLMGNILHFDKNYGAVNVLYKGIYVDDNGYPYINDKEKEAIAVFCTYIKKNKEGLLTNNGNVIQLALYLELTWKRLCSAARVAPYINLNDMNKILDAKVSMNRKLYGKSLKPTL